MTIAAHHETELKYEAGVKLPVLGGLPGVSGVDGPKVERLEAVYFDTADLRLARHGVTLRRRTGGHDAGWHLKVPAGDNSRTELRLPLDDGPTTNTPPDELVDLTSGMARGAEIRAVVLLKTERHVWELVGRKGKPLAEVADDRVTASRLDRDSTKDKWRELEVELADPDLAPTLDRAFRKAGLRRAQHSSKLARALAIEEEQPTGDTAGDVLLAYVRTQFDELVTQDLLVRRDAPDAVHQMRVAARRLRSALRAYRRLLPDTVRMQEDLRWLGRRLGESRDLEVQHAHLKDEIAALPEELVVGPVSARLTRHFGPAAAAARERVLKTLADKRYRRLLDAVDRLVADPPLTSRASRPAGKELRKHVGRTYRRTKRRMASDTLHQTRKAAKRYRYALEVAEPAVGGKAKRARKPARALTKLLGEHQDGTVVRPLLRELGMKAHLAGENGFTYGLLHDRERARCAEVERVCPDYWKRVRKTRLG
jgi:CHAD domain-containing protein